MRIHFIGLPHTPFDAEVASSCAFTVKAVNWVTMMTALGHELVVYWGGDDPGLEAEFVSCMSPDEQHAHFGDNPWATIRWDNNEAYWQRFNMRTYHELKNRIRPGDMIAFSAQAWQLAHLVEEFGLEHQIIEPNVGYSGIAAGSAAAFETYAWMHHVYGLHRIEDGRPDDAVIPVYLDPAKFHTGPDQGYAVVIARMVWRKGVDTAVELAHQYGIPLKIMGALGNVDEQGQLWDCEGNVVARPDQGSWEYLGEVGPDVRGDVLAGASMLLAPTRYIEAGNNAHCEALLSGVPVVASDWGAFTDNLDLGVHTFRTIEQGLEAMVHADAMRPKRSGSTRIANAARDKFSMDAVGPLFDAWLQRLAD